MSITPWGFPVAAVVLGALAAGIAFAPGPTARETPPMGPDPPNRRGTKMAPNTSEGKAAGLKDADAGLRGA